jgi:hypothetical protein
VTDSKGPEDTGDLEEYLEANAEELEEVPGCPICPDNEQHLCTGWHCDVCGIQVPKNHVLCGLHAQ